MLRYLAILLVLAAPARAQDLLFDRDLWAAVEKALADVSMPLSAHQGVQNVLQNAKREAETRAIRAQKQKSEPKE